MPMTTSTTDVHGTFTAAVPFRVPFYASCIRLSPTHFTSFPPIPFASSTYAHSSDGSDGSDGSGLPSMPIAEHTLALAKDCDAFYYIYLIVHNRTRLELTNTVCWCHTDVPAGTAPAIEMDIRLNFLHFFFGPSTFVAMTQCRQTYAFYFMKTVEHTLGTHLCHFGATKGKIAYFCRCWRCSCETTQFDFFPPSSFTCSLAVFEFRLFSFGMMTTRATTENRMLAKWFNKL